MWIERIIQFGMFTFLLIGLFGTFAWLSYQYFNENLILTVAVVALSWGTILAILYLGFKKAKWDWWDQKNRNHIKKLFNFKA